MTVLTQLPSRSRSRSRGRVQLRAPGALRGRGARRGGARTELEHVGALDGLRGLAVAAVILYHGGVSWANGGFLGVEIFFVLSGFLITSLLLTEWLRWGSIDLPAFWGRRARRLFPALFVLVLVVGIRYAIVGAGNGVPGFLGDGLSALFYFSNWHQIAAGTSYFAASGPVSPFQHTWSLAIEEQFYIVWPLLLLAVFAGLRRTRRRSGARSRHRAANELAEARARLASMRTLFLVTLVLLLASLIESLVLFDGGSGLNRVYFGTDTRAAGLLVGAALAMLVTLRREVAVHRIDPPGLATILPPRILRAVRLAPYGAFGLILLLVVVASGSAGWMYPLGLLIVDLCVVAIIASVTYQRGAPLDRLLSLPPLQAIGRISYGLYLWHFPLFLWIDEAGTGLSGLGLLAVRLLVTVTVSVASYVLIEQPIRQRRRPAWMVRGFTPLTAGAALASLLIASAAGALPTAVPAAAKLPPAPPPSLAGQDPACSVSEIDQPTYAVAPVPASQVASFVYSSLGKHRLVWEGETTGRFTTCPPKRVMFLGDSIALTIGTPMMDSEARYGVEIADAAELGCAFSTRGQLDVNGAWENPGGGCPNALTQWSQDERQFDPAEVIVELGYRDEFNWRWNGQLVHLGDPAFDAYVQGQMDDYVRVLGADGRKILFLSVPFVDPPAQANGSPAPAASAFRHALVNTMLRRAAATDPGNATVLDIDDTISPGGHYDSDVDGQLCRIDGIHFSEYCSQLLEPSVLRSARALLAH